MDPNMFGNNFAGMFGQQQLQPSGGGDTGSSSGGGGGMDGSNMGGINPAMFGGLDLSALQNNPQLAAALLQQQQQQQQQQSQPNTPQQPRFNPAMFNPAMMGLDQNGQGAGGINMQALQRAAAASGSNPMAAFNQQQMLLQQQQQQLQQQLQQRQGTPQQQQQQQGNQASRWPPQQQQQQQQQPPPQQQQQQSQQQIQQNLLAQLQNNGGAMFNNQNFGQMGQMGQQQQQPQQFGGGQLNPAALGLNPQMMALFQQNPMQAMQAMQTFGQLNPAAFPPGAFNQLMMQQLQQQQNQNQASGSNQPGQMPNMFQQAQNGNMAGMLDPAALMAGASNQQQQQQAGMFGGASVPGSSPVRPNSALPQQPPNGIPSYLQNSNQNLSQPGQSSPVPSHQQPGTPQQQQQNNANNGAVPSTPTTASKPKPPRKKAEKKTAAKSQPAQNQTPVMQHAHPPGNTSMQPSPSASSIAGIQGASLPGGAFERSRSHTRSPSVSLGGQGTPSQMHALPPGIQGLPQQQQPPQPLTPQHQMGLPGQPMQPGQSPAQQVVPPNWMPSLNPQQQQAVLSRALALAKAQEGSGLTPVHTLMQMGYLFLKASSLPGGSHPSMMPNGGMVLTINEARGLGLIPQQGAQPGPAGANAQGPQQQQQQPQQMQQPQRQPSFSGMQNQQQQGQQQGQQQSGFGAPPLTPQQQQQQQMMLAMQQQQQQMHQQQMQQQQTPLVAPQLGHPHGQRPTTPAGQQPSPSAMRAPSPMGPAGAISSPGMANKQRPRQPSLALSASGRPDSRGGPVPPPFQQQQQQQGGPQGLMAPPPAPGHMPPGMAPGMAMPPGMAPSGQGGQMPPGFGAPGGPQMNQDGTPPMLKQQGRRPSMAQDPSLGATADHRRPSMVGSAAPGMDGIAATTPDPMMMAAASAAAGQPSAQAQLMGSFGSATPTPKGRKGSQAAPSGMPGAAVPPGAPAPGETPSLPDTAADAAMATGKPTTLAGSTPAFAQAVPSNLANMPMLLGGPAPKESAIGTPLTHFNTRVSKLDDAMRPQRAAEDKGDAAESEGCKADDNPVWTPLTAEQEAELAGIMRRDLEYEKLFRQQQQEMEMSLKDRIDSVRPPRRKASDGTVTKPKPLSWWERPEEEDVSVLSRDVFRPFGVLFPNQKRAELEHGQRGARPHIPLKRSLMEMVSQQGEDLVPIRLEIDHEHWKLRDTFTWNAQDSHINVEAFAQSICEDIGLPATVFVPQIKEQITTQILDHQTTSAFKAKPTFDFKVDTKEGKGSLEDKDLRWWSKWRNKVDSLPFGTRAEQGANGASEDVAMHADDSSEEDEARSEPPEIVDTTPVEELRMMIKLDITVGAMNLVDQFEWDASESDSAAAEKFAEAFAADLGLSGEFKTAIAHSIREQVSVHVKSLAMTGHTFDGRPIADEELRAAFLGPVSKSNLSRGEIESYHFTPRLLQLTEAEIERLDREREREARRKRRQTRGRRGINLPDRDPQKTQRTPAVYGIQTAQTGADAALQNVNGLSDRYGGMSTRRAAAAAANASIAPSQSIDVGTPTPGPDGLGLPDRKKPKVNHHAIHFDFPGGLGRQTDPGGPKFAPEYTEEEAKKRARSPENQATGAQAEKPAPKLVSLSYAQRNNVRPEDLERQHPNFHDGMWHCSNCGIPGTLAPGRRKGPLGDKSLCGPCGKYYHRHRKVIFLEYTRDPLVHLKQQQALNRKMGISNPVIDSALLNALGEQGDSTEPTSAADTPKVDGGAEANDDATGADGNGVRRRGRPAASSLAASRDDVGDDQSDEEDLPFEMVGSPDDSDSSSRSSSPEPGQRSRKSASQSVANDDEASQIGRRAAADSARDKVTASFAATATAEAEAAMETEAQATSNDVVATKKEADDTAEASAGSTDANGVAVNSTTIPAAPAAAGTAGSPSGASVAVGTPTLSNASPRMAAMPGATPPDWLVESGAALKARYPNDRFEIQPRPRPAGVPPPPQAEWRVRCLDCPGKLYTPGPGESLTNFEIHLRNRQHRANVNKRVYGNSGPPAAATGASSPGAGGAAAGSPQAGAGQALPTA